jgi:hypothetical protein
VGGVVQNPVIKIKFNEDSVVEIDEILRLDLVKDTDSSLYGIGTGQISHDVLNDDKLNITFTESNHPELNGSPDSATQPFTYTWDKIIAANVPTINFTLESVCNIGDGNCAEFDISATSDFEIISDLIDIHRSGTVNPTLIPETGLELGLPVSYKLDTRVEADEILKIKISKEGKTGLPTNESGKSYIQSLILGGDTQSSNITLTSVILNDDFLNLQITDVTGADDNCDGTSVEDGANSCSTYKIAWANPVDADAGDITIPLSLPALSLNVRYVADGTVNPKDYTLSVSDDASITYADADADDGQHQLNLGDDLSVNGSTTLKVQIEDDDFVEPAEILTVSLNATGSPYVATINSNTAEEEILSYTIPIDDLLTVTVTGSGTSANEAGDADGVTNPFSYTTDKAIAPNTPELTMALTARSCTGACATVNSDFTLSGIPTLHSYSSPSAAVTTAQNFGLLIKPDNIVENDELINLQLSSNNSAYVQFSGIQDLSYTIKNNDKTTLSIATLDDSKADEGASGTSSTVTYTVNSSLEISRDVGNLSVGIELDTSNTTASSTGGSIDFSLPTTLPFHTTDTVSAAGKEVTFNIEVNGDSLVEYDETVTPKITFTENTYAKLDASKAVGRIHTITNDEFITLSLSGAEGTSLSELGTLVIEWSHAGTQLGANLSLALTATTAEVANDLATAGDDYEITTPTFTIPDKGSSASGSSGTFITVVDDTVLEKTESFTINFGGLTTLQQQVIQLSPQHTRTIVDSDVITVEAPSTVIEGDDTAVNQSYSINFCLPSSLHTIQDYSIGADPDSINYQLTINNTVENQDDLATNINNKDIFTGVVPVIDKTGSNNSYTNAVCGAGDDYDYGSCGAEVALSISPSDFDSADANKCIVKPVYTIYSDTTLAPNKHIQHTLAIASGETRSSGFDTQQLTILNDDFTNIVDTGLTECVRLSRSVDDNCYSNNGTRNAFVSKQDAKITTGTTINKLYPTLAYTAVNDVADAAFTTLSSTGNGSAYSTSMAYENAECFQDNNTGILWTNRLHNSGTTGEMDYSTVPAELLAAITYCGQEPSAWVMPTVQDLYSVMDMSHLKVQSDKKTPTTTLRGTSQYQADTAIIVNHPESKSSSFTNINKASYWSSDACTEGATSGYWTVDFFTGLTRCEVDATTNFKIYVFKP